MSQDWSETQALLACESLEERERLIADLFTRHRARLRRMVHLRFDLDLQRRLDPSDVVQESLLEASRRLEEYLRSRPMPFFNWLRFLTAQRLQKLRRFHRRTKSRDPRREVSYTQLPPVLSEKLAEQVVAQSPSPSDAVMRKELKKRVQDVLEAMEPLDREILVLRHFEDLTNAEAAGELGLQEPTAKQRYARALLRFRRAFSIKDGRGSSRGGR